jgi:hypothetical protein
MVCRIGEAEMKYHTDDDSCQCASEKPSGPLLGLIVMSH